MAANILHSDRAIQMSLFVVRAFVRLREQFSAWKQKKSKPMTGRYAYLYALHSPVVVVSSGLASLYIVMAGRCWTRRRERPASLLGGFQLPHPGLFPSGAQHRRRHVLHPYDGLYLLWEW